MADIKINGDRLWASLMEMAKIGATPKGGVCRLTLTDLDKQGRDLVTKWAREAGMTDYAPASGWWAQVAQSIGANDSLAVRYDYFIFNAGAASGASPSDPAKPDANSCVGTLGFALNHHFGEIVRIMLAYELVRNEVTGTAQDPSDDHFTAQFQAAF